MFPVVLDLTRIPILLTGHESLLIKRLEYLDAAKAAHVRVVCAKPSDGLRDIAGARLEERPAVEDDVKAAKVVLVAGVKRERAELIRSWAQAAGKLINVEDVSDLCDFYFTANVRRGDLVIGVSTSGASPTLARKVRDVLAQCFGVEWEERVSQISALRQKLRTEGADMHQTMAASEAFLAEQGWLDKPCLKKGCL
jgi:precorrin-2 dehydrogenase/sirohydrochlorin ferrochelatase